jgi:hypothetical protein
MNAALDVAIGLILMYLLLSLFCTTINEAIANFLKLRANTLQAAMQELIDDPKLKALFDAHGLIDGTKSASAGGTPAPAGSYPSYLSSQTVAMALIGCLGDQSKTIPIFADIEDAIGKLDDKWNIKDVLAGCVAQADNDIVKLRNAIAAWFDNAMDRLSGDYKRYLQWISVVIGLIIACTFNADTLNVASSLWNSPASSAAVAQNASAAAQTQTGMAAAPSGCINASDNGPFKQNAQNLCALESEMQPLPLGWTALPTGVNWLWKVLGLILTTIALTLGAPFWFDLLKQFVNLRGTGPKPDTVS